MLTTTERAPGDGAQDAALPLIHASHLALADQLLACSRSMRNHLTHPEAATHDEDDYLRGYMRALDDLAAHLRHGDYLPGEPPDETEPVASA